MSCHPFTSHPGAHFPLVRRIPGTQGPPPNQVREAEPQHSVFSINSPTLIPLPLLGAKLRPSNLVLCTQQVLGEAVLPNVPAAHYAAWLAPAQQPAWPR